MLNKHAKCHILNNIYYHSVLFPSKSLALLTSNIDVNSKELPEGSELDKSVNHGYERYKLQSEDDFSIAQYPDCSIGNKKDIRFEQNISTENWQPVVGIALLSGEDVISVFSLPNPVIIKPNQNFVIPTNGITIQY